MEELKELKRKANLFEGTDALLRLNEDVKKDLIEIQKTNSRVRMNADKSEQIFIELNKGFQENEKINQVIMNLDTSYSGIKKEIEKLNLDYKQILNVNDFNDFKKAIESKFIILENALADIDHLKNENDKFSTIIQRILFMEKRNESDIATFGLNSGNTDVKGMNDYEKKLSSILELMDKMSLEINKIKEKLGLKNLSSSEKSLTSGNVGEGGIEFPFEEDWDEKAKLINTPKLSINLNENPVENSQVQNTKNETEINDLLFSGENCLLNEDLAGAVKIYEEISDLYSPADDKDNLIYPKIIEFYEHLSSSINKPVSAPVNYNNPPTKTLPTEGKQYKKLKDY
jgi:hypothetical protein